MVLTCLLLSSPFPIPSSQLHTRPQWPQPRLYCRELKHRQEPQAHLPVCSLGLASWGSLGQPTWLLDSPGPRATCMLSLYGSYRPYLLRRLALGAGLLPPLRPWAAPRPALLLARETPARAGVSASISGRGCSVSGSRGHLVEDAADQAADLV